VQIRKENVVKTVFIATGNYKRAWVCNNISCAIPHYTREASLQLALSSHICGNHLNGSGKGYIPKKNHCSKPQDLISGFSLPSQMEDTYVTYFL
jgi:hypothetical protein